MQKFKFLEHTADIKFQAFGKNPEEVFENSALALIKSVTEDKINSKKKVKISVKGSDWESLMYNFLEDILFLIDAKNFLPGKFKIKIDPKEKILKTEIFGDDIKKYKVFMHVKAVTYNDMFVKNLGRGGWIAQVVLDI